MAGKIMGGKSTAKFVILALLLSTAFMSLISVLFVIISGYSIETVYAVSFVIMQIAFFCVIAYVLIRAREWLDGYLETREKYIESIIEIKEGIESLRENIEMISEKTDNIENEISCRK